MSSIWKDLLFLHGHLLHKDDLEWRAETAPAETPVAEAAEAPTASDKKAAALACCAIVWPRIMAPH
ncbi:MAG: hypothetical protein WBA65_05685 [Rhodanobacter sp.]|jgi:hypothetical protein